MVGRKRKIGIARKNGNTTCERRRFRAVAAYGPTRGGGQRGARFYQAGQAWLRMV